MSRSESSWDDLRREARQLENDLDTKLVGFSKLGAQYGSQEQSASEIQRQYEIMTLDIQQLLFKLSSAIDSMSEALKDGGATNAGQMHVLSRHRDILNDLTQEFNKTKTAIRYRRDRADLLPSVQRDIRNFRQAGSRNEELFLKENEHISNSSRVADETLSLAMHAKESLLKQRDTYRGVTGRMAALAQRFPAINNVAQKIGIRKRRDAIILGLVIAVCIIFCIWYIVG